jgi:toxin FitB
VTGWLLDTNVLSELRRPRPSRRVVNFVEAQRLDQLYTSTVTLAEIRYGIEVQSNAGLRSELHDWLEQRIRPLFSGRLLEVTEDVILRWRFLVQQGRNLGHTFSQPDLFIAATALHHGLTVVSRDTAEYSRAGVPVFDPWS